MRLMIIRALDHFSSDNLESRKNPCVAEFVGILEANNEKYVTLKHITADINQDDCGIELHNIIKSDIVSYFFIDIEENDFHKGTEVKF